MIPGLNIYDLAKSQVVQAAKAAKNTRSTTPSGTISNKQSKEGSAPSEMTYPVDGKKDLENSSIVFTSYEKGQGKGIASTIKLFIPDGISYSRNYTYEEEASDAFSDFISGGGGIKSVNDLLGKGVVKSLEGMNLGQAAAKLGYAANPNMEVYFKGPEFRTFNFEFPFYPKSQAESQSVKSIIEDFEEKSMPKITENKFVFQYPYVWKIVFKGNFNERANSKTCVLKNIDISYGGNTGGYMNFVDGTPVKTSLKLEFQEIQIDSR